MDIRNFTLNIITAGAFGLSGAAYAAALPQVQAPPGVPATTPPPITIDAQGNSPAAPDNAAVAPGQFNDAEILGVVNTVDEIEVKAAAKAEKKKIGPEAMAYAKMLQDQHKADLDANKALGKRIGVKPAGTKTADQLRDKAAQDLKAIASKSGSEFEKAYIDAMVDGHTDVLQMLDSQLIPSAHDDALKTHLAEVREHVAMHLEQGKRLQGARASAPAAD